VPGSPSAGTLFARFVSNTINKNTAATVRILFITNSNRELNFRRVGLHYRAAFPNRLNAIPTQYTPEELARKPELTAKRMGRKPSATSGVRIEGYGLQPVHKIS